MKPHTEKELARAKRVRDRKLDALHQKFKEEDADARAELG